MLIFRCSTTLFLPLSNLIVSVQNWKPPLSHFLLQLIYPQCDTISPLSLKLGLTSLTPTTQFPLTPQVAETILVRDWQKITDPYLIIDENVLEEVCSYSFVFSHYKKRGFRPRLKNAAIDPKNAAIGYSRVFYSRVYKRGLNSAAIVL